MRKFRVRSDLRRAVIDGFALPLGLLPGGMEAPTQGYTVEYAPGEDDEPDSYSFHAVVSHERLVDLLDEVFGLLPDEVNGIVEIGSRDAYRSIDVYMGQNPISLESYQAIWKRYEAFLLEDGSIAAGANSEEPFMEIFLDQWKGLWIHAPLSMRGRVEQVLEKFGLMEVPETWPEEGIEAEEEESRLRLRAVLSLDDEYSPDVDELLLELRHAWNLELNVDPDKNVDDGGRALGRTLWHALIVVESATDPDAGGYASVWATASSLSEMDQLIDRALEDRPEWVFGEIYAIDRVAYDERPDELREISPRREESGLHLVSFDEWSVGGEAGGGDEPRRGGDANG